VSVWTFKSLDEVPTASVPYADTLVKRSSCDKLGIWRNRDGSNTIFNTESKSACARLDIPKTDCSITTTRCNSSSIAGKVKGVDVLLVTSKRISDGSGLNIPNLPGLAHTNSRGIFHTYSNQLILGTSCQVSTVRTETNTSDVQISYGIDRLVLEYADLLTSDNVKDLRRSITASCNIFSIVTETNTTYYTLVLQCVYKINIKNSRDFWIEDGEPIRVDLLLMVG